MDWHTWHREYSVPGSRLERRLRVVQERIRLTLDGCPPGELRIVSLCAGQGRDLLEVLEAHSRRGDVRARLVELDRRNAAAAQRAAGAAGLAQVEVVTGDAALTDQYRGIVPVDIVLACGLFGHISDADIRRTIDSLSRLCRSGGTAIWTRHRRPPDLVPDICAWFEEKGFELEYLTARDAGFGVGVHRFAGIPRPLTAGVRMFSFPERRTSANSARR